MSKLTILRWMKNLLSILGPKKFSIIMHNILRFDCQNISGIFFITVLCILVRGWRLGLGSFFRLTQVSYVRVKCRLKGLKIFSFSNKLSIHSSSWIATLLSQWCWLQICQFTTAISIIELTYRYGIMLLRNTSKKVKHLSFRLTLVPVQKTMQAKD